MTEAPTTIEDLAPLVRGTAAAVDALTEAMNAGFQIMQAGFETMNERFNGLEARMDDFEARMDRLEKTQNEQTAILADHGRQLHDLNTRVDTLLGSTAALEADAKELYRLIAELRRDFNRNAEALKRYQPRLERLEAFTQAIAQQTGIAFPS